MACRFQYYRRRDKESDVGDTYKNGTPDLRAKFISRISALSKLPREEWNSVMFKPLKGDCAGLFEIRFKANRVQQRPIGYFSASDEFTVLVWAEERNGRFVPKSACEIAFRRKAEFEADRGLSNEF